MTEPPHPRGFLPLTHLSFDLLLTLADQDLHGYAILCELEKIRDSGPALDTGTLYAALKRLRDEGLIEPGEPLPGEDRRRRRYRISELGRAVLELECRRQAAQLALARTKGLVAEGLD